MLLPQVMLVLLRNAGLASHTTAYSVQQKLLFLSCINFASSFLNGLYCLSRVPTKYGCNSTSIKLT